MKTTDQRPAAGSVTTRRGYWSSKYGVEFSGHAEARSRPPIACACFRKEPSEAGRRDQEARIRWRVRSGQPGLWIANAARAADTASPGRFLQPKPKKAPAMPESLNAFPSCGHPSRQSPEGVGLARAGGIHPMRRNGGRLVIDVLLRRHRRCEEVANIVRRPVFRNTRERAGRGGPEAESQVGNRATLLGSISAAPGMRRLYAKSAGAS